MLVHPSVSAHDAFIILPNNAPKARTQHTEWSIHRKSQRSTARWLMIRAVVEAAPSVICLHVGLLLQVNVLSHVYGDVACCKTAVFEVGVDCCFRWESQALQLTYV